MMKMSSQTQKSNMAKLMYMPSQGKLFGMSSIGYTTFSYDTRNASSGSQTKTSTIDQSKMTFYQELAMGVQDGLSIGGILGYQFSGDIETQTFTSSAAKVTTSETGLVDPELYLRFRIMNQKTDGMNFDMKGIVSPSFSNKTNATSTEDGSAGRGGFKVGAEGILGSESDTFNWSGAIGVNYTMTRTIEQQDIEITEYDAQLAAYLLARMQVMSGDMLAIGGGLDVYYFGSLTQTNLLTNTQSAEFGSYLDFRVVGNMDMTLTPDTLNVFAEVGYTFGGDIDRDSPSSVLNSKQVLENRKGLDAKLAVKFQF